MADEKITTVDGVRAVEMRYRQIRNTSTFESKFFQSSMRLNAPLLGVLLPERFMPVLETDDRAAEIFALGLLQTLKAAEKFREREYNFDWISICMPLRVLKMDNCLDLCREAANRCGMSFKNICIEIPPIILDNADDDKYMKNLRKLKITGFKTMVTGIGGNSYPLIRLAPFEFDYVMISDEVISMLADDTPRSDACVESVVSFINNLDAEPVANGVENEKQAEKLFDMECTYYTGAYSFKGNFAGNFLLERYIRKKD